MNITTTGCKLLLATAMLGATTTHAQNALPVISSLKVTADSIQRTITVHYDLADADNQQLKVDLRLSNDGGKTFLLTPANPKGAIGNAVRTGRQKKISFSYAPSEIPSLSLLKVKLIADDGYKINIETLLREVDTASLRRTLESVAIIRTPDSEQGTRNLNTVRTMLLDAFRKQNIDTYTQDTSFNGNLVQNIIGRISGTDNPADVYVLAAHYDAVEGSPGADDNASGVAAVLEAARILSKYNFSSTIQFVAFDLEEIGLLGSRTYLQRRPPHENIKGLLNCDMLGFATDEEETQQIPEGFSFMFPEQHAKVEKDRFRANFLVISASDEAKSLAAEFERTAAKYVPDLKMIALVMEGPAEAAQQVTRGDHTPFWEAGLPAIMIGDSGPARNANYHSRSDVLTDINYTFLYKAVKSTLATLASLARLQHSTYAVAGIF